MMGNKNPKKAWTKGQSGNPNGRPKKGNALTDILRQYINTKDETGVLRKKILSEKLWELVLNGDIIAIKYIFDRIDGKPDETINTDVTYRVKEPEIL